MTNQNDPNMVNLLDKINAASQGVNQNVSEAQKSYEVYVDQLINERGFTDLTQEVRDQLKKDLVARLDKFIAAKVIAALSDQDVLAFEQLLKDQRPTEEIQKFTIEHVPDFTTFLTNTLLEFRAVYLGLIQAPVSLEANLVATQKADSQESKPRAMPPAPPQTTSTVNQKKVVN